MAHQIGRLPVFICGPPFSKISETSWSIKAVLLHLHFSKFSSVFIIHLRVEMYINCAQYYAFAHILWPVVGILL